MKKFLKILGILLGSLIVIIASVATYVHFKGIPTYDAPKIPEVKVESTPERIAKGEKIASMLCIHCHSDANNKLVGKRIIDLPPAFGEIYSMNITHDATKGIGNWTDGELIYFLRTGLRKDGSYAPPYMPKFPLLSDEDMNSIISWLRSDAYGLKASSEEPPASKPGFLMKALSNFVDGAKPLPFPASATPVPDTTNKEVWGKYLANNLYACFACHSADFATNSELAPEQSKGFYGGGNKLLDLQGKLILSKNITPDGTGIGTWTEQDFVNAMRYGKRKNGKQLRYPMLPYNQLTEGEISAIYAYLRTIPAINNTIAD